jgi:dipeptide/tripeptide permease
VTLFVKPQHSGHPSRYIAACSGPAHLVLTGHSEGTPVSYFFFSLYFAAIFLGSTTSLMLAEDENWREHWVIWGGFALVGVLAVLIFFHMNRAWFRQYAQDPQHHSISEILWGKKKR